MNTLTLKTFPIRWQAAAITIIDDCMRLSMSIGVTIAGMLLGMFGKQHIGIDGSATSRLYVHGYVWRLLSRHRR